jgi:hypothetical protein
MDLIHLRYEIRALAALPPIERIARLKASFWIGYGHANNALGKLKELLAAEPGRLRQENLLIIGPTDNGKTMIAEKLRRDHPPRANKDTVGEVVPVFMVRIPPNPSATRFHEAVLAALNAPLGLHGRSDQREALVLTLMRAVGVRMLIFDDLDNLLAGSGRRQKELMTLMLRLGHVLHIPIVGLGTKDVYVAIRADDQLNAHFQLCVLPTWTDNSEFARLLASFEAMLPLREPSGLTAPPIRKLVIRFSKGIIGEIAALLVRATTAALLAGREHIDAISIEAAARSQAAFETPGAIERRCLADRRCA